METVMKSLALGIVVFLITAGWVNVKVTSRQIDKSFNAKTDPRRAKVEAICSSCHLFVEPEVLDKATWANSVLPAMGTRLGIHKHKGVKYSSSKGEPNTEGIFPANPVLNAVEWQNILDYFNKYAPVSVAPQVRKQGFIVNLPTFKVQVVGGNKEPPIVSMVKINHNQGYCFYDDGSKSLCMMNSIGELSAYGVYQNPISSILPFKNGFLVSMIGSIYPSDEWLGKISYLEIVGNRIIEKEVIRENVERPVFLQTGDIDGNGSLDIVVCGFGHNKGSFYWLKKVGDRWEKQNIIQIPGAIRTQLVDIDKDGDLDIITLFAQGIEKLVLFKNDGTGKFNQQDLLKFSPVQGSSFFEMKDINKDGFLDILYTCGDNADFSVVLKKFHGVYIFLGNEKGNYIQKYFYPMNGAYKALAEDFDGDGDLDIAAISYFADYVHQPYEGFLFFEQKMPLEFQVRSHPATNKGRWLTMDVGDIDGDKDPDIVLGNFSVGPTTVPENISERWQLGPITMVLQNLSSNFVKKDSLKR